MNLRHLTHRLKKLEAIVAERRRTEREAAIQTLRTTRIAALAQTLGREGAVKLRDEIKRAKGPVPFPPELRKQYAHNLRMRLNRLAGTDSDPFRILTESEIEAVLFKGDLKR
jgi:hypothetical protein